jgi:hypothetical protein
MSGHIARLHARLYAYHWVIPPYVRESGRGHKDSPHQELLLVVMISIPAGKECENKSLVTLIAQKQGTNNHLLAILAWSDSQ